MKFKWEQIYRSENSYTERAKVIGGWIVSNFSKNSERSSICESMVFIPNTKHKWIISD